MDRYLKPRQAAEIAGVSVATVRSWLRSSPPVVRAVRVNGRWRVRLSDLLAVLEGGRP